MEIPDHVVDNIVSLLADCRFKKNRTRSKAEQAIQLIEKWHYGEIYIIQRGLVVYPDLLDRYLKICKELPSDDFSSMISRCIENSTDDWAEPSLDLLLNFYKTYPEKICLSPSDYRRLGNPDIPELRNPLLLTSKYSIGVWLYDKCKVLGLSDPYLDAKKEGKTIPYTHPGPYLMEKNGIGYGGYRHAYHLLMYGGSRRVELITRWKEWETDCTFEAACDFFNLPTNSLQCLVENRIHELIKKEPSPYC